MKKLFLLFVSVGILYGEFVKSENIVIDNAKNLMWQDNKESTYTEDITMGVTYCEELVLNGYIDWKLPTIKQLQSLIDQDGKKHYLEKTFEFFESGNYWSSTPNVSEKEQYWYVDFKSGKVAFLDKENLNYVRCVREIK